MPQKKGFIPENKTKWTEDMVSFLQSNYKCMTNKQLAAALNLRRTVTRNKMRELGLKRIQLEYWNNEMVEFLKHSYKTLGDVEIMNFFKKHYPKRKGWRRWAIMQKRQYLGLKRTGQEIAAILKRHRKKGGAMYTIHKNSSSINMHPTWIAQRIAWRDPELQNELLKHPDIIEAARQIILLNRMIRQKKVA